MVAVIKPLYPKADNGLRPYLLENILRIHRMQMHASGVTVALTSAITAIMQSADY